MTPDSYDRNITVAGIIKVVLQFLVVMYIGKYFIYQEIKEVHTHTHNYFIKWVANHLHQIRESIQQARQIGDRLRLYLKDQAVVSNPVIAGLKVYLSEPWNYYGTTF